jgi:alkylated DNA repair dioxygenase AlkB
MVQPSLLNYFASPSSSKSNDGIRKSKTNPVKTSKVSANRSRSSHRTNEADLVPGLSVIPEFILSTVEEDLLLFLENQPWRTDLARRTMHFGGTYCLMPSGTQDAIEPKPKPEIITAPPIPPDFHDLMERFFKEGIYNPGAPPEYCIVNEYKAAHGISAHVENFTFGEPVCSLTLHDGDHMRFHELEAAHDGSVRSGKSRLAKRTGRKVDVWLPPRSLAVLRGDARYKWQHEIVRSRTGRLPCRPGEEWKRTSLTFRVKR